MTAHYVQDNFDEIRPAFKKYKERLIWPGCVAIYDSCSIRPGERYDRPITSLYYVSGPPFVLAGPPLATGQNVENGLKTEAKSSQIILLWEAHLGFILLPGHLQRLLVVNSTMISEEEAP